jgi:hypothetical protein
VRTSSFFAVFIPNSLKALENVAKNTEMIVKCAKQVDGEGRIATPQNQKNTLPR